MSTRSLVGKVLPSGKIKSIYVHSDGYLSYNGVKLVGHWTDPKKVNALLGLGDLSVLGKVVGEKHDFDKAYDFRVPQPVRDEMPEVIEDWCLAYGRDRGETGCNARIVKDFAAFAAFVGDSWAEYVYLFVDGRWIFSPTYNTELTDISVLQPITLEALRSFVMVGIVEDAQDAEIAYACQLAGWEVPEDIAERLQKKKEQIAKTT